MVVRTRFAREARTERDRLQALVNGGANPAQVARIERAAQTERAESSFSAIAIELLEKRTREGLTPASVKRERRLIEKDLACIGDISITDVTAPALLAALRKLEKRGVAETAHRMRSLSNSNWRMRSGIRSGAPTAVPPAWLSERR